MELENPEIHFQVYKNSFITESYIIDIQFADIIKNTTVWLNGARKPQNTLASI